MTVGKLDIERLTVRSIIRAALVLKSSKFTPSNNVGVCFRIEIWCRIDSKSRRADANWVVCCGCCLAS